MYWYIPRYRQTDTPNRDVSVTSKPNGDDLRRQANHLLWTLKRCLLVCTLPCHICVFYFIACHFLTVRHEISWLCFHSCNMINSCPVSWVPVPRLNTRWVTQVDWTGYFSVELWRVLDGTMHHSPFQRRWTGGTAAVNGMEERDRVDASTNFCSRPVAVTGRRYLRHRPVDANHLC